MDKGLSFLGLAKRAGKVITGTDMVCDKMGNKEVYFVFVASDASPATIEKMEKKTFFYHVPMNKSFTTYELNSSIGCENVKVIGITDPGFSEGFRKKVKVEGEIKYEG